MTLGRDEYFNRDKRLAEQKAIDAKEQAAAALVRGELLKAIGKMPGGIDFFNWIFDAGGLNTETFAGNSSDAFRHGMRVVPRLIQEELKRADWPTYTACEARRFENERRDTDKSDR